MNFKALNDTLVRALLLAAASLLGPQVGAADFVLFEENDARDLSDDPLAPTRLGSLRIGSSTLSARFNRAFPDYFTLTVPDGLVLRGITLDTWDAEPFEDIAFAAVQHGTAFTFDSSSGTAEGLLGWTHLRKAQVGKPGAVSKEMGLANLHPADSGLNEIYAEEADSNPYADVGLGDAEQAQLNERLRNLGNTWAPGAEGFEQPLGPGTYSFWLRQGSDVLIDVELTFVAGVAKPAPLALSATLAVSKSAKRKHPAPLEGSELRGDVRVHLLPLRPREEIEGVRFFIDGRHFRTEQRAPYDLAGSTRAGTKALAFDTRRLTNGRHRLSIEIELASGRQIHRTATFEVHNRSRHHHK